MKQVPNVAFSRAAQLLARLHVSFFHLGPLELELPIGAEGYEAWWEMLHQD